MAQLQEIVDYANQRLVAEGIDDYCPNGLQIEASEGVRTLVTGVTASLDLIQAAAEIGADALLVHHGYFWRGEPEPLTGIKGRRVSLLYRNSISLIAYHLPLDMHPELGNNVQLGRRLGLVDIQPMASEPLVWTGLLPSPQSAEEFSGQLEACLDRAPLHIKAGPEQLRRIAWCTGAAQGYIEQAVAAGCDAYVSGEISEHTVHIARESGIHYFAAGHHATERFGVQALGEELAEKFDLRHQFVDIPNPV